MKLSNEDSQLFYKLWMPLLNYVNEQKKIKPNLHNMHLATSLDPNDVKEVADALWSETDLIDDYLSEHKEIQGENKELIQSWKRCVSGGFILERILKRGAILISEDYEDVYQVSGIISSWEEMFGYARLPLILKATLIPFRDVIISDGLVRSFNNVILGGGVARELKDVYMEEKKKGTIHTKL